MKYLVNFKEFDVGGEIAGFSIWFALVGPRGAVSQSFRADYTQGVMDIPVTDTGCFVHSPEPFQGAAENEYCSYLDGPCYIDGGSRPWMAEMFYKHGEKPVWQELQDTYEVWFND